MIDSLIFLPGLLNNSRLWHHQVNFFQHKYNIITPILSKHNDIRLMARYVLSLTEENFNLIGFSMGGYVALEIMNIAPQRVKKLALLNTSARPDIHEIIKMRKQQINLANHGTFYGITPRIIPQILHKKNINNKSITNILFEMAKNIGRQGFINQQTAILSRQDQRPILKKIFQKTLIIGGYGDKRTPPDLQQEMHELLPNSEINILNDIGHLSALEQPDKVNQLLEKWLNSK